MINKKQFVFSQKIALIIICGQLILKLFHFAKLTASIATIFAIFHIWALLLIAAGMLLYYLFLASIFYLGCRILNYTFNLIYH